MWISGAKISDSVLFNFCLETRFSVFFPVAASIGMLAMS